MICKFCQDDDKKSTITALGGFTTLLGHQPFYDEKGVYHNHDPNTHISGYKCSNGHRFKIKHLSKCPNCDYNNETNNEQELC